MRTGLIYMYTNKINGKKYIGQTVQLLEKRDRKHLKEKSDTYFDRTYRKYGKEAFDLIVLEDNIPEDELDEKEIFYIKKYNTFYLYGEGYNMTKGGKRVYPICKTTPIQADEVKKLLMETKLTYKEIAKQVGTTFYSVCGISLGDSFYDSNLKYPLRNNKRPANVDEKMFNEIVNELLNTKMNFNDIAQKHNVAICTINRINNGKYEKYLKDGISYPIRKVIKDSTYMNKLNGEQVKNICFDLIFSDMFMKDIAKKNNVAYNTVSDISRGLTWGNITNCLIYPIRLNKKENSKLFEQIMV